MNMENMNDQVTDKESAVGDSSPYNLFKAKKLVGCSKASQIILIAFNVLSGALGLALIGACIWIRYDKFFHLSINTLRNIDQGTVASLKFTATIWIFVGAFIFVLSFLGCFGAWQKSKVFLGLYSGCIIVLVVIQLAVIFFLLSYKGAFNTQLRVSMNSTFHKLILPSYSSSSPPSINEMKKDDNNAHNSDLSKRSSTKLTTSAQAALNKKRAAAKIFEVIEKSVKCCGLHGPSDYTSPPESCYAKKKAANNQPILHKKGCLDKLDDHINRHLPAILALQIVFISIEFLSILLASAVGLGIPERYDDNN